MAIELAVALAAIVAKTLISGAIEGSSVTPEVWAGVATQVVDVLVTTPVRSESGGGDLYTRIDRVGQQISALPAREFDQHMAAGQRYLRDLPADWRTAQDRRDLIRDARSEFVRAFAVAQLMADVRRQALAEVAIAGCWLWVPSLPDVKNTIAHARKILEQELLFGRTSPTADYADVLVLCRSYGERPARSAAPIVPATGGAPTPGARIAVHAVLNQWVECAGIEVRLFWVDRPSWKRTAHRWCRAANWHRRGPRAEPSDSCCH